MIGFALAKNARPPSSGINLKTTAKTIGRSVALGQLCKISPLSTKAITVQLGLKKQLMCDAVRPIQVISNGKDNVSSHPVDTDDVN
jgi:hypothetical protein